MATPVFIGPHPPGREMNQHHGSGEAHTEVVGVVRSLNVRKVAFSFQFLKFISRVELPDIGNEVGFDAARQAVAKGDVLLRKVVRLRVALEKMEIVSEDKFFIVEELHIKRRGSDAQKPRLRIHGVVLMPKIGRNCEGRSYLPFEGFFAAVVVPQSGGSLAFDDDGYFIKQLPSRRSSLRGRDFQNVGVIELGSGKINERAVGIARAPKSNGNFARVFHKEARMNGNTLGLLPN